MRNSKLLMAGAALVFLAGSVGLAQAQSTGPTDQNPAAKKKQTHGRASRGTPEDNSYRPLTVGGVVAAPVEAGADIAGAGLGTAGAALGGLGNFVTAPIAGLGGGAVGISPNAAPPLPIKARFERTGPVSDSIEEGYNKPVPVDKSGPIYQLDSDAVARGVTPFSLLAFPLTGVTSILTSPLRGTPGAL